MTLTPVRVPLQRAEVDTADIGFAHELLSRAYVDHQMRLFHEPPKFVFRSRSISAGELSLDHLTHTAPVQTDTEAYGPRINVLTVLARPLRDRARTPSLATRSR